MTPTRPQLVAWLAARLQPAAGAWLREASAEVGAGVDDDRFCALVSAASRHARRSVALDPTAAELDAAARVLPGWNPERWNLLETVRVALVLARPDLEQEAGLRAIEEAFRYADEGELCALYRSLAHLPRPERFAWRAGEGCRSNMRSVFEATALDTPYPAACFEDIAWRQAVIKCIFVGAPLWRMDRLDERLSPELARMALDLADERRSAHRPVQPELWLCLGTHGGERGVESLERELDPANSHTLGRMAAAWALARADERERLGERLEREAHASVAEAMREALAGPTTSTTFRRFDPTLQAAS